MPRVKIETTQNVALNFEVATIGDRMLGGIIDELIKLTYFIFALIILNKVNLKINTDYIFYIVVLLPIMIYSLVSEIFFNGRTVGKMAAKTKVMRLDGSQPDVSNYFLRWVLRLIDIYLLGLPAIAIVSIVISDKGQRLGDLAAGTTVIKMRRRVFLSDTILSQAKATYIPVFEQVKILNDADISIIKSIYLSASKDQNFEIIQSLARKISEVMNVHTQLPPIQFILTVLKDYSEINEAGIV